MPKIHIKGKFAPNTTPTIDSFRLSDDCQTCGGEFDIVIPYDLDKVKQTTIDGEAKTKPNGDRNITAK